MRDQLFLKISGREPSSRHAAQSWIELTLDPPKKTNQITKEELFNFLDATVGIEDHCTAELADDAYDPTDQQDSVEQRIQTALGGETCYESADLLAMYEKCSFSHRAGTPKKFKVYAHCSSETIRDRYRFTSSSDITPTGPRRKESVIQVIIDFTDAAEVPVYRYAESNDVSDLWKKDDFAPQWLGDVLIGTRRIDSGLIGVGWVNGRIVLSEPVSGRLVVFLPIKYNVHDVTVIGTVINGKRDYTATAYAFDESLSAPASVELDDEQDAPEEGSDCQLCSGTDTPVGGFGGITDDDDPPELPCQLRTDWKKRNECTGDLIGSGTRYSDTQCPDKRTTQVDYTNEGTPDSAKWNTSEYINTCCEEPKRESCLPCKKIIRTYNGGAPVLPSEQYWRDRYRPSQVIFNRVGRKDGLPCGTRTDEFVGTGETCCETGYVLVVGKIDDVIRIDSGGQTIYASSSDDHIGSSVVQEKIFFDATLPLEIIGIDNLQDRRAISYTVYYGGFEVYSVTIEEPSNHPDTVIFHHKTFPPFCRGGND